MRPIVAGYRTRTGTKKEYCSACGLSPDTLDYWRRLIKEEEKLEQEKEQTTKSHSNRVGFAAIPAPKTSSASALANPSAYTLHLPDGKRLDLPTATPIEILTHLLQIQI